MASVAAIRNTTAEVAVVGEDAGEAWVDAVDSGAVGTTFRLPVVSGVQALDRGQALVSDSTDVAVGDELEVAVPGAEPLRLEVVGVFESNPVFSDYVVEARDLAEVAPRADHVAAIVTAAEGASAGALAKELDKRLLEEFPLVTADTRSQFADAVRGNLDQAVMAITLLLGLALLIALLGVANTLALSIVERTRELGLLRAIGLTRRQLRRMVRIETLLLAAYGVLAGLAIGLAAGQAVAVVLMDDPDAGVAMPGVRLVLIAVVALAAALVAAALPARRAARLDVLKAIATS